MPEPESTEVLVRHALEGSDMAFVRLLDRCAVRLALFIRRTAGRARSPDFDEEDIYQSVVVQARGELSSFHPRGTDSFYRWLTAFARHMIQNRIRYLEGKGRDLVRHLESGPASGIANNGAVASGPSPSSLAGHREEIERIHRAIGSLPAELREVVELYYLEEMSLSELASTLGISKSTAWQRLRKGIGALRTVVGGIIASSGAEP